MKLSVREKQISNLMKYKKYERKVSNQTLLLISIIYLFALNFTLRKYSIVWYTIAAVCIAYYFFIIVKKNKVLKLDSYCTWILVFFGYTVASYIWCINVNRENMITRTLIPLVVTNILVENIIREEKDLEALLFIFYLILFVTAITILLSVDFSKLGIVRVGMDMENLNVWNANKIGKMNAVLAMISLHYLIKKKKIVSNGLYMAGLILGLFLCFNSGSRKGLLYILLFIILFFGFQKSGKKRIFYFAIGIILLLGLYIVVMNYEPVYNVLGYRIEQMIRGIMMRGKQEASYSIREKMIELGVTWWIKRPILGYGFGNYSVLYYRTVGVDTYSHCNFIEILVGGGIVGFILYYGIYVIIYRLFKKNKGRNNDEQKTLFYIILVELILNIANVVYYDWMSHLLIMMSYISLKYQSGIRGEKCS